MPRPKRTLQRGSRAAPLWQNWARRNNAPPLYRYLCVNRNGDSTMFTLKQSLRAALIAMVAGGALVAATSPGFAREDHWRGDARWDHHWRERAWRHHEWREHHRYAYAPGYAYAPRYVYPPVYAPAPVYVAPATPYLSFGVTLR
jgi:hypothetical protein